MIAQHRQSLGTRPLCQALSEPRSSFYRSLHHRSSCPGKRPSPRRALSNEERDRVLETLNSERFRDVAPGEVFATLLDEEQYLCSERTIYRILSRQGQSTQRRQAPTRQYTKPELLATRPNELWSWDITKLHGPTKWTYYYLYKIIDVFSRYVVGWMIAYKESDTLAQDLIGETCLRHGIEPGQLTIHADRGNAMRSRLVAQLYATSGSPRLIHGLMSPTTTRTPRQRSRRSNTVPTSPNVLAPLRMPGISVERSLTGIIIIIGTAGLQCSRRQASITGPRNPSCMSERSP